jgi:hypothetical protein
LTVTLVHVEVESREGVAAFRKPMARYYQTLRQRYECPVLPVAVYLRVALDGVGVDAYIDEYDERSLIRRSDP